MNKTITDLRETLFETIEMVKSGKITAERAQIVGDLAQNIINSAKAENDFLKLNKSSVGNNETGFISGKVSPQTKQITTSKPTQISKPHDEPYQFAKSIF